MFFPDKYNPLTLVRWIASFLEERHAKVMFGGTLSKLRRMRQQGSVLSPLLFVFYINELAERLEEELPGLDAVIAMIARTMYRSWPGITVLRKQL